MTAWYECWGEPRGKLMIIRQGVNHLCWVLGLVMYPYLNAERSLILTHETMPRWQFAVYTWQLKCQIMILKFGMKIFKL